MEEWERLYAGAIALMDGHFSEPLEGVEDLEGDPVYPHTHKVVVNPGDLEGYPTGTPCLNGMSVLVSEVAPPGKPFYVKKGGKYG